MVSGVIKEKEFAHKVRLANIRLTEHMQIDLAHGNVADSVVCRANINTSLVPVHFLNYIRWGHVLVLACGRVEEVEQERWGRMKRRKLWLISVGIFFISHCSAATASSSSAAPSVHPQ